MRPTLRSGLAAGALVLLLQGSADAFGWAGRSYAVYYYPAPAYRVAYYYPVPCWSVPVYYPPMMAVHPSPLLPAPVRYAQPWPAPPSGTPEPPLEKRAPKITESRYGSGNTETTATVKDQLRVGFWNLTGRDVTLTIDGKRHPLPRNRAITLTLARKFTWNLDDGAARVEDIPRDQATFEVLLRPPGG